MKTFKMKNGFTLAEVLITLGVIGIVAAMTIPTLVQNYNEKATVTKVKKFYSTISQAYQLSTIDYGKASEWGIEDRDVGSKDEEEETYNAVNAILFRDKLLKYVKTSKVCDNAKDQKACGFADEIYHRNGTIVGVISGSSRPTVSAALADGSSVMFIAGGTKRGSGVLAKTYGNIYYDVNGIKPPNTLGKDVFMFYLTNQNIIPCGTENETYYPFSKCVGPSNNFACTAWVVYNGNMDYLHCDDLSWDGKHKCSE